MAAAAVGVAGPAVVVAAAAVGVAGPAVVVAAAAVGVAGPAVVVAAAAVGVAGPAVVVPAAAVGVTGPAVVVAAAAVGVAGPTVVVPAAAVGVIGAAVGVTAAAVVVPALAILPGVVTTPAAAPKAWILVTTALIVPRSTNPVNRDITIRLLATGLVAMALSSAWSSDSRLPTANTTMLMLDDISRRASKANEFNNNTELHCRD